MTATNTDESNISLPTISGDFQGFINLLPYQYEIRTQSSYLHDDGSVFEAHEINQLLEKDLTNRITQVGENLAGLMFPDVAFGFPINDQFVAEFHGTFISPGGILDQHNFNDDDSTAVFLNRMISTIAHFLDATNQISLKPLRYFTSINSTKALQGHAIKRKPDNILLHLVNGYLQEGPFHWRDPQALVEHTREKKAPKRLAETVSVKSYLTFCCQPERDFVICLCITGEGFHIVMTDHVGQVETDVIPFSRNVSTMVFFRMVMGFAFLPDSFLGFDTTMTRHQSLKHSNEVFAEKYKPFPYGNDKPSILLFASSPGLSSHHSSSVTSTPLLPSVSSPSVSSTPVSPDSDKEISTISVGTNVYKVIRLLFRSQTLIGRATRAFLVQFPDGRYGVLKDSWITVERGLEAAFLQGLSIPYGPDLVDQCSLRKTDIFRKYPISPSLNNECREKRRIVTYPAGVHISDFSSLLELMFAFFDVVLCM
jgi:hypothetical protein